MKSAPAKLILLGEHAVVYGQPAIAVPFETLAATVEAQPALVGAGLTIRAHDTGAEFRIISDTETYGGELAYAAQLTIAHLGAALPDLILHVRSTIPIGSGFGSGAAVSTALIRELSAALGAPLEDKALNQLVYEVEKMYHGTPSGIDNTVIVFGRPLYFIREKPPELFSLGTQLTLIIADSGIAHSTRETVGDVRKLYDADPARITPILHQIGVICQMARRAIEAGDPVTLGALMTENHRLLQSLTVSSDALDRIVQAACTGGALGAKLSGGGRGGSLIALVQPEQAEAVAAAMLDAGAIKTWQTVIE